jgi:hypothetical protein
VIVREFRGLLTFHQKVRIFPEMHVPGGKITVWQKKFRISALHLLDQFETLVPLPGVEQQETFIS